MKCHLCQNCITTYNYYFEVIYVNIHRNLINYTVFNFNLKIYGLTQAFNKNQCIFFMVCHLCQNYNFRKSYQTDRYLLKQSIFTKLIDI